ncbi:hypothetical protein EYF80_023600 [Liparis tanakae]|uniref:Uncharacterized protein n=1 Tax=Liparis tanakae TaxID=230148 RepID=A0A4Z2HMV6_9TELE|nr:hypothetical protein EYF80_023600 [Liparis tanakae]
MSTSTFSSSATLKGLFWVSLVSYGATHLYVSVTNGWVTFPPPLTCPATSSSEGKIMMLRRTEGRSFGEKNTERLVHRSNPNVGGTPTKRMLKGYRCASMTSRRTPRVLDAGDARCDGEGRREGRKQASDSFCCGELKQRCAAAESLKATEAGGGRALQHSWDTNTFHNDFNFSNTEINFQD